jgi:hypothetical protein
VSRANAERFLQEGVCTIAELANSDPVDLALRTNQPFHLVQMHEARVASALAEAHRSRDSLRRAA